MDKREPTQTKDITGEIIRLGDICFYDIPEDEYSEFEIVFEDNAFRKKYLDWDKTLTKPILSQFDVNNLRIKIKK